MKKEVDVAKILLKCLNVELQKLEESEDDREATYFYASASEVAAIMLFCGLLNQDEFHELDCRIDIILDQTLERLHS